MALSKQDVVVYRQHFANTKVRLGIHGSLLSHVDFGDVVLILHGHRFDSEMCCIDSASGTHQPGTGEI